MKWRRRKRRRLARLPLRRRPALTPRLRGVLA